MQPGPMNQQTHPAGAVGFGKLGGDDGKPTETVRLAP